MDNTNNFFYIRGRSTNSHDLILSIFYVFLLGNPIKSNYKEFLPNIAWKSYLFCT